MACICLLILALAALPPLSDSQRAQLDSANDSSPANDEAALYPLLENALAWTPGDESGAAVPDYAALLAEPAAYRGDLFLIEGEFAGRPRRIPLARSGQWGSGVTEWVVRVREDPDEVAVVYFVDPDGELEAPLRGTPIRTVARFYKVWSDRDLANEPTPFLIFVGRTPTVVAVESSVQGPGMGGWVLTLIALAAGFYILRRYVVGLRQPRPLATRREFEAAIAEIEEDDPPSLTEDPAEALDTMSRQSEARSDDQP